jgi:hypothetical protein
MADQPEGKVFDEAAFLHALFITKHDFEKQKSGIAGLQNIVKDTEFDALYQVFRDYWLAVHYLDERFETEFIDVIAKQSSYQALQPDWFIKATS